MFCYPQILPLQGYCHSASQQTALGPMLSTPTVLSDMSSYWQALSWLGAPSVCIYILGRSISQHHIAESE